MQETLSSSDRRSVSFPFCLCFEFKGIIGECPTLHVNAIICKDFLIALSSSWSFYSSDIRGRDVWTEGSKNSLKIVFMFAFGDNKILFHGCVGFFKVAFSIFYCSLWACICICVDAHICRL